MDVAELSVLAAALEVPPVQLMYPDLADGQVEVLPARYVRSVEAARWFAGEAGLPLLDDEADYQSWLTQVEAWKANALPLIQSKRLQSIRDDTDGAERRIKDTNNPRLKENWERELTLRLENLYELVLDMRAGGLKVDDE
ncbi:hypothetical protein CBI38_24625 [Rhodococcus oxybenzonivorans]|uniref:Uncharacterized protein n=1 Tax=Rhodococcus oxybenzonivorans TaxID=1990687 RepID=A0A2S2C0A7_9NOCA|nr:hypothetical protein [Rhodococcus oxybenzonivorans]AWK74263.1 hypothetical protein CBI38_24625 [Rhodococcus oxybenzonivorans]